MLRPNSSIVNLNNLSSTSLLQSLVNHRPKSQQHKKNRVSSAKQTKPTQHFKQVTSSLCSPLFTNPNQRTNETMKPMQLQKQIDFFQSDMTDPPQQSQRELKEQNQNKSAIKSNKKQSLIQRTMVNSSTSNLIIKQKTVKLTRDSRSSSKKDLSVGISQSIRFKDDFEEKSIKEEKKEEIRPLEKKESLQTNEKKSEKKEDKKEDQEANQKINQLINKYKNISYFQEQPLMEQDQNISKYVTRVSKGSSIIPVKPQQKQINPQRKRMNSPIHRQRKSKENESISLQSQKKLRGFSADRKQTQSLPFGEFEYYMSYLRYFNNKDRRQETAIKNSFNNSLKTIQYFSELYTDHFMQSYHALQFCKDFSKPTIEEISKKIVQLPQNKFQKTIVFDLDETLIHCQESNDDPADIILTINFPNGETVDAGINVRPYCREMLSILSQKYEIIVFTASHECYAQKVLNFIDPERKLIHHRFFRESCVVVADGLHIKDLRILGNRNLKDVVLIDNASYSFYFQLETGIPIIPFYDNPLDKELQYLTVYLQELMCDTDIPNKNVNFFKSSYYLQEQSMEQLSSKL